MKKWTSSKTVWFNVLTLLATVVALPEVTGLLPDGALRFVVAFQAIVNVVLRLSTTQGIKAPGRTR